MASYTKFDKLFKQCYRYCMPVLKKYAITEQDAEDAFTEAITIFWMHWKRGSIKNRKNIPAFVCTTAVRLLHKQNKNRVTTIEDKVLSDEAAVEDLLNNSLGKSLGHKTLLLKKAFKKLGEACQQLITAKYIYKHSYEEIAEDFGQKNFQVTKTQTHRCLKRVKTYYSKELLETKR
ncbi:MAG: RNA polymerase sigma factor [Chitinophagales bacterium]